MARANFVKKAQKDIYRSGKSVSYKGLRGKREGQMKTKIDRTIPRDANDTILIAKGESYWWWAFKNGGKHFSKTKPKPSQLTQSNYLSTLYSIQESTEELSASEATDLEGMVDEIKSQLEELRDETQNSLDNMPDSLQSSPTGELLQERVDALDNIISEFDGLDLDYNEPDEEELRSEAIEALQLDEDDEESLQDNETEINAEMERIKEEKAQEWINEKIQEIQDISFD